MTQDHIVSSYDQELTDLHDALNAMAKAVKALLGDAVKGLASGDVEQAKRLIKRDKVIDQMQLDIDTQATRLIALRAPVAADLRAVLASYRMSNDLERMGDLAKNIAKRTVALGDNTYLQEQGKSMIRLADLVMGMIDDVVTLYDNQSAEGAKALIDKDQAVDDLHSSQFREILSYMMEDPSKITALTHYLFITKNIERIGDHVTNIAEQIYYLVTGELVDDMHQNYDESSNLSDES